MWALKGAVGAAEVRLPNAWALQVVQGGLLVGLAQGTCMVKWHR